MKKIVAILLVCAACGMVSSVWATPEPIPAVENLGTGASVKGGNGHIYFTAGNSDAVFGIYAITGQLIKQVKVSADNHASVEMPTGFYIVRYNNQWSRKVVVK